MRQAIFLGIAAIIFLFPIQRIFGEVDLNSQNISECYNAFLLEYFADETSRVIERRIDSPQKARLHSALKWAGSTAGKKVFESMMKNFSPEEIGYLKSFYEARRFEFSTSFSPEMQNKIIDLLVDYEMALINGADLINIPFQSTTGKVNNSHDSFYQNNSSAPQLNDTNEVKIHNAKGHLNSFVFDDINTNLGGEGNYHICLGIEVIFDGEDDEPFHLLQGEIRDSISSFLVKITMEKAKEDFGKQYLHKILKGLIEDICEKRFPRRVKIQELFIPKFFVK